MRNRFNSDYVAGKLDMATASRNKRLKGTRMPGRSVQRWCIYDALFPNKIVSVDELHAKLVPIKDFDHGESHTWDAIVGMVVEGWLEVLSLDDTTDHVALTPACIDYFSKAQRPLPASATVKPVEEVKVEDADEDEVLESYSPLYDAQTLEYGVEQRVLVAVMQSLSKSMMGIDKRLAALEAAATPPQVPEEEWVLVNIQSPINLKDRPLIDGTTLRLSQDEFDAFQDYINSI